MRTLTINKQILNPQHRGIGEYTVNIGEVDENGFKPVMIFTHEPHNLAKKGKVVLLPDNSPFTKSYDYESIDKTTFIIHIPEFSVLEVNNYASGENNALIELVTDDLGAYVVNTTDIKLRFLNEEFSGRTQPLIDNNGTLLNAEDAAFRMILCDKPLPFNGNGFVEVKNDWYLKNGAFNTNIRIEEELCGIDISIPLQHEPEYRASNEQEMLNAYLSDVQTSIIPEIVDNEKRQFFPVYYKNKCLKVREIVFNLHFRDRYDLDLNDGTFREGWKTSDEQFWNGLSVKRGEETITEDDDILAYDVKGLDDSYADTLDYLGFTADDIRFGKAKIKKSFIRLSYYSSKDMLQKELLAYSTIFLDSGELYNTYNKISGLKLPIFDKTRIDKNLRLSASFSIKNNRFSKKSSEGFYLYLFPSEIDSENMAKTIYMKVEFNHAGYGKTIPMMLPRTENGKIINSTDSNFPLNFTPTVMDKNGNVGVDFDFEGYHNAIMIPIEIKYDSQMKDYVYHFPFISSNDGKIELNLFEPRIKSRG